VLIFLVVLSACAQQTIWLKPGAQADEFNQDKYACMQQSQQPNSSAYVNRYGGFSNSGMITNGNLFGACMNASGWILTPVADAKKFNTSFKALDDEWQQTCLNSEFRVLFAKKMPCKAIDATPEQLSDRTKITPVEKVALSKWETFVEGYNERIAALDKQVFTKGGDAMTSVVQRATDKIKNDVSDLNNGQITWGDFNERRVDITKQTQQDAKTALAN
jgi:hypothetical protein